MLWSERSRFGSRRWVPLRRYARLVGAPNCAPSLCSVAGLLLALALESGYEDPPPLLHRSVRYTQARGRDAQTEFPLGPFALEPFSALRSCRTTALPLGALRRPRVARVQLRNRIG